jgi:methylated-DNA-protein-cysteine methyltransferase-like protein
MRRTESESSIFEQKVVTAGFHERVYEVVKRVPVGKVTTYGDVGTVLGSPRVARQVGWALAALSVERARDEVPWHRVINAQGRVSFKGDAVRAGLQEALLRGEGHVFNEGGRLDLERARYAFAELDQELGLIV